MSNSESVFYFGYGANCAPRMVAAIIGRRPTVVDTNVAIRGYDLCVQYLEHIPDKAREILEEAWGNSFESYGVQPAKQFYVMKKCPEDRAVWGTLYEITPEEREIIAAWEMIPEEWYTPIELDVKLTNGSSVLAQTEIIVGQEVAYIAVDGKNYPTYLIPKEALLKKAEEVRPETLASPTSQAPTTSRPSIQMQLVNMQRALNAFAITCESRITPAGN